MIQPNDGANRIDLLSPAASPHPGSEDIEVALRIGLTHISYAYENGNSNSALTPGVLDSLIALGNDWFDRELAARLYLDRGFENVGILSSLRAHARVKFRGWALDSTNLRDVVKVGKGVDPGQISAKMASDVLFTLLGKLVHSRLEDVAVKLVSRFFVDLLSERTPSTDPITALTQIVPVAQQTWAYSKQGPDHAPVFEAALSVTDGRSSVGSAAGKKLARMQAADEFVRRYGSYETSKITPFSLPRNIELPPTTEQVRNALMRHQLIEPDWRPLVQQAFLHSSWVSENKELANRTNQTDNRLLAFVGATVLSYDYTRSVVSSQIDDKPASYTHLTQTNESLTLAAKLLRLDRAILLGRGQRANGTQPEMVASCLQALAGALYLSLGEPESLTALLSQEWAPALPILNPAMPRDQDPVTKLQELLVKTRLDHSYATVSTSGPMNGRMFIVELKVSSPGTNSSTSTQSTQCSSVKGAKADAARPLIRALEWLRQPLGQPTPSIASHIEFFRTHLDAIDESSEHDRPANINTFTETPYSKSSGCNGDPKALTSAENSVDKKYARLAFEVLPDALGTRSFVADRQIHYERKTSNTMSALDHKRTDILDLLARRYKQKKCTLYTGYSTSKSELDVGDNINEDYLILVISRGGGEDAIAISPAARRHATYVVRHEVAKLPWQEVFANPKYAAKDLGAKRLLFRDRYPLDQYRSMFEKIKLLLDCAPKSINNKMLYQTRNFTYAFRK
ncbi:hypothetical protein HQO39_22360 [Rhodococcus fascians]|nr:hypothetical protein [Rhodococcus fascians]